MLAHPTSEAGIPKCYETPILRTLRFEQAALFLVGYAYEGHRGAFEMMKVLFPLPSSNGDPQNG
jgi:hypothetical protein